MGERVIYYLNKTFIFFLYMVLFPIVHWKCILHHNISFLEIENNNKTKEWTNACSILAPI